MKRQQSSDTPHCCSWTHSPPPTQWNVLPHYIFFWLVKAPLTKKKYIYILFGVPPGEGLATNTLQTHLESLKFWILHKMLLRQAWPRFEHRDSSVFCWRVWSVRVYERGNKNTFSSQKKMGKSRPYKQLWNRRMTEIKKRRKNGARKSTTNDTKPTGVKWRKERKTRQNF